MKKTGFCLILLSAAFSWATAADFSSYSRIMTDSGNREPHSFEALSNSGKQLVKKLPLDVEPADVKAAALEFEVYANAYDHTTKMKIADAKYNWHDMEFTVNGQRIFCGNPGALALRGVHQIEFDPKLLQKGENVFKMGWTKRAKGDPRIIGRFYVAVDYSEGEQARRKIPVKERPAPDNDDIRVRLLIKL